MLCLWQPTFNHMRRSLDGFTSRLAPIRAAVRASSRSNRLAAGWRSASYQMQQSLFFTAPGLSLLMLPFALHGRLGLSAQDTALMLTPWPLALLWTTPIASRLLHHAHPAQLCAVGALMLSVGLFRTPNNPIMFLAAPLDRAASAGGVQGTARLAGQMTGALSASILLSAATIQTASLSAFGIAALNAFTSAGVSRSNDHEKRPYLPD